MTDEWTKEDEAHYKLLDKRRKEHATQIARNEIAEKLHALAKRVVDGDVNVMVSLKSTTPHTSELTISFRE